MSNGPNKLHRIPRLVADKNGRRTFTKRARYATPEELYAACYDYFEWCDENPIMTRRLVTVSNGGGMGSSVEQHELPQPRMYTETGLCLHLGIGHNTWLSWKDPMHALYWEEAVDVIDWAITVVREQNLTEAAVGGLNPMLVMRIHGIREQMDLKSVNHTTVDSDDGINPELLSPDERLLLYKAMKRQEDAKKDELLE